MMKRESFRHFQVFKIFKVIKDFFITKKTFGQMDFILGLYTNEIDELSKTMQQLVSFLKSDCPDGISKALINR